MDLHGANKCVTRSGSQLHQCDKVPSSWQKEHLLHVKELRVWPTEAREENDVTGQQHAAKLHRLHDDSLSLHSRSLIKLSSVNRCSLLGEHLQMIEYSSCSSITCAFFYFNV